MKKSFVYILVFMIALLCYFPVCFAEEEDNQSELLERGKKEAFESNSFSMYFPDNFNIETPDITENESSDFFTKQSIYEVNGEYEYFSVTVGENSDLNTLFSENFGFARREDLDLSLLTEKELRDEAEKLTSYIDAAFPLYMTYLDPTSISADGRLGLVITGFYTDYDGELTGEFRAYEFYYMGRTIIIYYDTQIEGTFFSDSVLELPDSIVSTLDFEVDSSAAPINPKRYSQAIQLALPVVVTLLGALLLGFIIGKIGKRKYEPDKAEEGAPEPATSDDAEYEDILEADIKEAQALPESSDEQIIEEIASSYETEAESVDWNSIISELREKEEQESTEEKTEAEEPKPLKEIDPIDGEEASVDDELMDQIEAIGKEIDENIKETSILASEFESKYKEVTGKIKQDIADATIAKEEAEAETNPEKKMSDSNTKEEFGTEISYEKYLKSILPGKKKSKKKEKTKTEKERNLDEPKEVLEEIEESAEIKKPQEPPKKDTIEAEAPITPKRDEKKGFASKLLSSIVKKIETDGEEDDEPEFDSRTEMHISEKTEKNSVESLMPGLFDDSPQEEELEILIDETEDLKFEQRKKEESAGEEKAEDNTKGKKDILKIFKRKKEEENDNE